MESGPAVFAGTAFVLFGAALLLWTGVRVHGRVPVAEGVRPVTGAIVSLLAGVAALGGGIWYLGCA
ncbi:hypothetical protein LRS74_15000 [Streptomyces sp. LX-29]|uniref:hypothetical protein n=1 Tax=Streptomyces sp. LX-29 TaxID=2900152 RepID=UPI00240D17D8|nr:hypothetical protein [Streptomyces sp. LX-29]WFB08214.1 hypothetical protein LRS74_15000 [Streptomyces sp. LX-29]